MRAQTVLGALVAGPVFADGMCIGFAAAVLGVIAVLACTGIRPARKRRQE